MHNIADIKSRVKLSAYLASSPYHIVVKNGRCAAKWRGGERDSVAIDDDKGTWCDHGNGDVGGDLFKLVQVVESVEGFPAAVRLLCERFNIPDSQKSKETATYDYTDENGVVLYRVLRYEPGFKGEKKTFVQMKVDAFGNVIKGKGCMDGVRRVPYHLPRLIEGVSKNIRIYIVEGEKDVENVEKLGLYATCNAGGAGKWRDEYSDFFKGAEIVTIIADRDGAEKDYPGQRHAEKVRVSLERAGVKASVVYVGDASCKDASDWIARGATADDFNALADNPPKWDPPWQSQEATASATADADGGDGATQGEEQRIESERLLFQPLDERLLNPEGLVGKIANYIRRSSIIERSQFALSASLCLCSTLLGRWVYDAVSHSGVNLYTLNLLDGGGGKDDAYTAGDRFLYALGNGCEQLVLNGPASGAGLIDMVIERQSGLITIDEAGEFLARMLESNKPDGNYTQLRKIVKELYSRSKLGSLFKQDQRARTQAGKYIGAAVVKQPSVSLFLTGAPNRIASALSSEEVSDGLLPRFLFFFEEGAKEIDLRRRREPIPQSLLQELTDALNKIDALRKDLQPFGIRAFLLDSTDEALDLFQQFEHDYRVVKDKKRTEGDYACGAWVRCVENARRVAATVEMFRHPANPIIDRYDAEYSIELLKCLCGNEERFVRGKLADDEFFHTVVKVQDLFRRKGQRIAQQRHLSRSELLKASKMDVVEFDKVIAFLSETEWLEKYEKETKTRKCVMYRSGCRVD